MLPPSLFVVFASLICMASASLDVPTPNTWSVEYHLPSTTTVNPLPFNLGKESQARNRKYSTNYNRGQQQSLFSWNGIRQQTILPVADFHPSDGVATAAITNYQKPPRPFEGASLQHNRSFTSTQVNLVDLLARLYSSSAHLARSDTKHQKMAQMKHPDTKHRSIASRYLHNPAVGEQQSTGGVVHFDEPLDQPAANFEDKELDQSGNSHGRDFVTLWYDSPQTNLISEPRIAKQTTAHDTQPPVAASMVDNLFSSSKYSAHHMPAIYSIPVPIADTSHKMISRKGGLDKSIMVSILVGIGAGLLSFLLISNLFLSIPLLAMTLLQFYNSQNMIMPNNNMPTMPTSIPQNNQATAGRRRKRKKRDLSNVLISIDNKLTSVHNSLDKALQRYD